jgi:hypothetical protein
VASERTTRRPVTIAATLAELSEGAEHRQVIVASDGKSGNTLERFRVGGEQRVLKRLTLEGDWIMRVMGDRAFWPYCVAQAGLYDRVPPSVDHAILAVALEGGAPDGVLGVLMDDVGAHLVPEGDARVPADQHVGFLTHMAALHHAFWGWRDDVGLQSVRQRLLAFAPATIASELDRAEVPVPIAVADQGWSRLPDRRPAMATVLERLHERPMPLVDALARTPVTFLHGDWKMGNLGTHPDGRTILLDWAYLGSGPPTWDLMWYLALNAARLPESKEASIERYRAALVDLGVDLDGWWDEQVDLAALAIMVSFGWEKAVGADDELDWWADRVARGARRLA